MGKSKKYKKYSSSSGEESDYKSHKVKSKRKKRSYSSSSSSEEVSKLKSRKQKYKGEYSSSSDSASSSESSDEGYRDKRRDRKTSKSDNFVPEFKEVQEYKEKESKLLERDSWMNVQTQFATTSNSDRRRARDEKKKLEREKQQYDPRNCDRELNPYWKDGGEGLPTFKKPVDTNFNDEKSIYRSHNRYSGSSSWRKKNETLEESKSSPSTSSNWRKRKDVEEKVKDDKKPPDEINEKLQEDTEEFTEKDLNTLAAKLLKAEIMGNTKLQQELKDKLEKARNSVKSAPKEVDDYILTETDSKGQSKPLRLQAEYGESSTKHKRKKKVETHQSKERVRYFADDDKYSLKQMFENEKYNTGTDNDKEFLKTLSKIRKNDDLDEMFSDNIRQKESDSKTDEKNKSRAISNHQKISRSLENCDRCIQSEAMPKHLMLSMGETVYLSLPSFEPLTEGHCLINPINHTPCATQLDENEWNDVLNVRKSLVKMFRAENMSVIFFECAMSLHRFPHMVIECVPVPVEEGDMAPIYFKKAIDESEIEWAQNKKLVSLKGRDVRKAIPKGLAYFSVSFGMEEGFAHVIEDERLFPTNFAQEIIGGMLDLHHSKWRKPKRQNFEEQSKRVREFSKKWKNFDCFTTY